MEKTFKELYMESSKHSNYQTLPNALKSLIDDSSFEIHSRYENERFEYITEKLDLKEKTVLDIGGNIGFFSFESESAGARKVDYYERNLTHAMFVKKAVKELNLNNKIEVCPECYLFKNEVKKYDICFLLNVVHHFGDDFGVGVSMEAAKKEMLKCINYMAGVTKVLVFQMGFNWCGNIKKCLFENGTKKEMCDYIKYGTSKYWEITSIGVAVNLSDRIKYEDITADNCHRIDCLGEFLNRPIFIMKSKKI